MWTSARRGHPLRASLTDPSGYPPLDNLSDVEIRAMSERGMLLYGTDWHSKRGEFIEAPQAWWCVVASTTRAASTSD